MNDSNESKAAGNSLGALAHVSLLIVCFAILALFVYDYLKKNKEIADYKKQDVARAERAEEKATQLEVKLEKVKELADLYKKTLNENIRARIAAEKAVKPDPTPQTSDVSNKKIQKIEVVSLDAAPSRDDVSRVDLARKVSSDLAPIISKVNKSQDLTNEKLDKAIAELIVLLDKETAKSQRITKNLTKLLIAERRRGDRLQRKLTLTNGIVTELSTFAAELGTLYVNAHEDDSVLGNIGTAAMAPVKVVQNTLSMNLCFGRDKIRAEKMVRRRLRQIMERYSKIEKLGMRRRVRSGAKIKEPKLKKENGK